LKGAQYVQETTSKSPKILKVRQDRNYDCVYLKGKKIILGRTGTPEAEAAYRQLQIRILTDTTLDFLKPEQVTVDTLCLGYLQYTKEHDPSHYAGMVQVQRLASMRPNEVYRMKPGEIDTEYTTLDGVVIWMYTLGSHT